ncbi:MAG: CoA transferase [Dehalococcoidia bacterium]|nr:CoA transferase [Dehalococcoidia bacterium]
MKAFEGLKVLDFSRVIAAPLATEYLAQSGATVVKVESSESLDNLRISAPYRDNKLGVDRSGYFAAYNGGKYSLSLDLGHPGAKTVIERLVRWCDVVVENFRPGTTEKFGISYDELVKLKPDIIMLSTSNQGQTGPQAKTPGYGFTLCALSGLTSITGWSDRPQCHPFGALTDYMTPWLSLIALISAIEHRRQTGEGQFLDVSQYECGLYFLAPLLLDYAVNGHELTRQGNSSPHAAPHGAYPCRGDPPQAGWCAISAGSEQEWVTFCRVIGKPELATDPRFCSLEKRKANEDELDAIVAEWTSRRTAKEVMETLQRAGIAAGVVQSAGDLFADPQLRHRQHFHVLEHPEIGAMSYEAPAFRLSETPLEIERPAPCLGQHNEYVCKELLGIPDDEFVRLLAEGVLS